MRRRAHVLAHSLVLSAAAGLSACVTGGPTAPIEYRGAQGAPSPIEHRSASAQPAGNAAAESRFTSPAPLPTPSNPAVVLPERPDRIIVQPGDTLFQITERYRLTLEQVIAANGLREPYLLRAGQTLILPQWPTYTVREGDTVSEIALAANVDMPSLLLLNYIEDPDNLRAGQVLILPELPDGAQSAAARPARAGAGPAPGLVAPATAAAERVTSTAAATGTGTFDWPVRGEIISSFGPKAAGQRNDGVNIRAAEGTPVRAAGDGSVVYAGNELAGYGELLLVKHDNGMITAYAHNRRLLVQEGTRVARGQTIAEVGQTGSVNSPQLHFEVRNGVEPIDPMRYMPPA